MDLLDSGASADVYVLDDERVLRRYRSRVDAAPEAAVMRYVASHGYPVPAVYEVDGTDLILERLAGTTMVDGIRSGAVGVMESSEVLADLHRTLHALPAPDGAAPGECLLHLDLHPANVMLTPRGPVVIDWHNARTGPPDLDVALSALILAQVAVDPDLPPGLAAGARAMLVAFVSAADGDPLSELDGAVTYRRADPNQADVLDLIDAARRLVESSLP